jgi:TolA-binding protein
MPSSNRPEAMIRALPLAIALAIACPGASAGGNREPAAPSLTALGLEYESIPSTGAERIPALSALEAEVSRMKTNDAEERAGARFLLGEIQRQLGDWKEAGDSFRQAAGDGTAFADDAAFAAIEALEGAGRDEDAARAWSKWREHYPESPLEAEAALRQVWNALRRERIAEADRFAREAIQAEPAVASDPRWVLARAMLAIAQGHPERALAGLETGAESKAGAARGGRGIPGWEAATTYVRAICYDRAGAALKAAALYQEVAERYPDSPLRDSAMLAKADIFFASRDYRSAAQEMARVVERAQDPGVKAEAELRQAAAVFLAGDAASARDLLSSVIAQHAGSDVAARAQFLIGEVARSEGRHADAIVAFNQVLAVYFEHAVAASAQYRVARSLDALDRRKEATGAYQAVVAGYPLSPESPAAAYLAGVGLLAQSRPLDAAPYFQIVLDRYAGRDSVGSVVFASPAHQELVEAALCLVEYSYHQSGNLGLVSGAPHLLLEKMPPSRSPWRAHALLYDADASAAQGRYPEAQATLERLFREFPGHPMGAAANRLLAWTYARQGKDSLAIATEERMVAQYSQNGDRGHLGSAELHIAHARFNQKDYARAVAGYQSFLQHFPNHPERLVARYQAALALLRLDRAGDAVDQWEAILSDSATAPIAERAWARAGDVYFQAEKYAEAKRCYEGLLRHFGGSSAASIASLRLAQCEYNAGQDAAAVAAYSTVIERFPDTPAAREASRGTEMALYRLGKSKGGSEALAKLVAEHPTSAFAADAQFQVAQAAYEAKRYPEAIEGFRRVVAQFPGSSVADRAQFLLADSEAQLGHAEAAQLAYEQFLSYFPASELRPAVQFRLGMCHFTAKNPLSAAVMFTAVLGDSLGTDMASAALYNLALCQRLMGQTAEAEGGLARYRRTYPGDARAAEVAYQLGDLAETANRLPEAAAEFERAIAADPKPALLAELCWRLGQAREKLGDSAGATRPYTQSMTQAPKGDAFRLSAVARLAALHEADGDRQGALACYRDLAQNSPDHELAAAAKSRAAELAPAKAAKAKAKASSAKSAD